ncbi:MAG: hypothetical protein WAV56_04615 [Microgenomates group bacterium]
MKIEHEIAKRWMRAAFHQEGNGPYDWMACRNHLMDHFCQDCLEKALGRKIEYRGYGCLAYLGEGVCEECEQTKPMIKEMSWEEYEQKREVKE